MAGRKGSTTLGHTFFMLMAMSRLFGIVDAEEQYSPSLLRDNSSPGFASSPKLGKISFNEDWDVSDAPMTCTCNCYPVPESSPQPPSQRSHEGRTRSAPPAPYYQSSPPSPVYENPAPPASSTKSPVTFTSPPPTAPYGAAPGYGQPAPVVAAPETFIPSPPSPIY